MHKKCVKSAVTLLQCKHMTICRLKVAKKKEQKNATGDEPLQKTVLNS